MSTIREALEAAATDLEGGGNADAAPADVSPPPSSPGGNEGAVPGAEAVGRAEASSPGDETPEARASAAARSRDGKGRFASGVSTPQAPALATRGGGDKTPGGTGNGKAPGQDGATTTPPPPVVTSPADKPESLKPPQSWKPAAREEWAKLSPAVQAEVHRREREVATGLQEGAPAKRFMESFAQAVAPFRHVIQAEGGNPLQTVAGLLQTADALRGPDKEAVMARIIKQFGGNIERLAAHLDNAPVPAGQQQGEFRDPRFDQFLGTLQQRAEQKQQAVAQKAMSDIEAFKANAEFIEDVREDMSVILARAAERGVGMSLQEAYDRACWAEPDIRGILQQRKAAEAANASQASTQRARNAAASVKGQPAGGVGGSPSSSIRGALEAAAARLNGR